MREEIEKLCLEHLGVTSVSDIKTWWEKEYKIDKLDKVVEFLNKNKNTPILICGDYDVDGDCSIAILWLMLKEAGFTNVRYRAPRRFSEGFGLNEAMINELDSGIIITCDNGIAAVPAIKKAKDKGLTVIITDHHMPVVENGETVLPPADIIIDPKAIPGSADFDGYCGAGICFKLAQKMLEKDNPLMPQLETLAACATVADVMPLREENWVIVRKGLAYMADRVTTIGLAALLDEFKIEVPSADDLGFRIGPALNAPGRLIDDGSLWSVRLLIEEDPSAAKKMAHRLHNVNERRKELVKDGMRKAEKEVCPEDAFITLYVPGISEGVIGILAGQITETYGVPSIVFTDTDGDGILKGSGRSSTVDLKALLDECPELFIKYGGHSGAAGLTASIDMLEKIKTELDKRCRLKKVEKAPEKEFDVSITAEEVPSAYKCISRFAPFGEGNEPVKFKISGYVPEEQKTVGDGIKLTDSSGLVALKFENIEPEYPQCMTLYGTLGANIYKGKQTVQIMFDKAV